MLRLTNSEVHIIMGNTHAIAKKFNLYKKSILRFIYKITQGTAILPPVIKKSGYNSGEIRLFE